MHPSILIFRIFPYSKNTIFKKYRDPIALSRWWGPSGNTNTFHSFDFQKGGNWILTMHCNGQKYHNEWKFLEIEEDKIILQHTNAPFFYLEVMFEELEPNKTKMTWNSIFQNFEFYNEMYEYLIEKNEENFNRLEKELSLYPS